MKRACEKRPIGMEQLDQIIGEIERYYQDRGDREIQSQEIGQFVMAKLKELDEVAYVRFASVYREFKDISEFVNELKSLKEDGAKEERLQN